VGYDNKLSKRTDVYAGYLSDKVSGPSTGNTHAVGIRHRF
jgi:predicted porin